MQAIQNLIQKVRATRAQRIAQPGSRARLKLGATVKIVLAVVFVLPVIFLMFLSRTPSSLKPEKYTETGTLAQPSARGFGAFGSEEERYDYLVQKTERDYAGLEKSLALQKEINKELLLTLQELKASFSLLEKKVDSMPEEVKSSMKKAMTQIDNKMKAMLPTATEAEDGTMLLPGRLRIITVPHEAGKVQGEVEHRKYVYLPTGSFVKATLLTGAYAPCDKANPLPVLISVDEAFYGPNMTRVPLKGCFAIGKAIADYNSSRAVIQIVDLAYVSPKGKVFETHDNLGWIAGEDGILGIPGQLVRRTGKELTGAFASGFLSGAAEALSQAETSPVEDGRIVAGDVGKYAGFSGLSEAAGIMSKYYANLLDEIITAVKIDMGKPCYLIMQKGVEIEGLTPEEVSTASPYTGVD